MSKPSLKFRLIHLFKEWPVKRLMIAIEKNDTDQVIQALNQLPQGAIHHTFPIRHHEDGDSHFDYGHYYTTWDTALEKAMRERCNPDIIASLLEAGASITPSVMDELSNVYYLKHPNKTPEHEQRFAQILQLFTAFDAPWHSKLGSFSDSKTYAQQLKEKVSKELYSQAEIPEFIPVTKPIAEQILARRKQSLLSQDKVTISRRASP